MSSSDASDEVLVFLHQGWEHLKLQRPLAAWAAWQRALSLKPDDQAAQQALDLLRSADDLPAAARTAYRFRMPENEIRRARWNDRLQGSEEYDLSRAADAFRLLVADDPTDASAWYNSALCLAWRGANALAIAALERVVSLDAKDHDESAASAWALAEILRQGAGAEHLADDLSHSLNVSLQNGALDMAAMGAVYPLPAPIDPALGRPRFKDVRAFEWLDRPMPEPAAHLSVADLPRVLASVIQSPRSLRLSSPDPQRLSEAQARLGVALSESDEPSRREANPLPIRLMDASVWTFRLPAGLDDETKRSLSRAAVELHFENVWIHWPRHGLDGRGPIEAAQAAAEGDQMARAKLSGVVLIREQLARRTQTVELYGGYPFDRLRRRLGLEMIDANAVDPFDHSCMSGAELDQLHPADLDDIALADAFESAEGLGDDGRTARLGAVLADRLPKATCRIHIDALRLFATLVRHSLDEGNSEQALGWLDRAVNFDAEFAGGCHRRTYDIWRAELHARIGSPDAAVQIYHSILERNPTDAHLALDAAATLLDGGYLDHVRKLAAQARELARLAGDTAAEARAEVLLSRAE